MEAGLQQGQGMDISQERADASLKEGQKVLGPDRTPYPGPAFPRDVGVVPEVGGRTWGALRGSELKKEKEG